MGWRRRGAERPLPSLSSPSSARAPPTSSGAGRWPNAWLHHRWVAWCSAGAAQQPGRRNASFAHRAWAASWPRQTNAQLNITAGGAQDIENFRENIKAGCELTRCCNCKAVMLSFNKAL